MGWLIEKVDGPEWDSTSCINCGGSPGSHEMEGYDDVCERFYGEKQKVLRATFTGKSETYESDTHPSPGGLVDELAKCSGFMSISIHTALELGREIERVWRDG